MRFGIRYQLLLPLIALMLGVAVMSTWTALASAQAAARHIEKQMEDVAATAVKSQSFLRDHQILGLMKRLSGADFLLCDGQMQPILDGNGRPFTTFDQRTPTALPEPASDDTHDLGPRVQVGGKVYFCRGVDLGEKTTRPGRYLYVFYPESLWQQALDQAVRPALIVGGIGGIVALVLSASLTGRVARRIQEIGRRTRLIAGGDFSPMPLPARNDELRDLAGSINDMAQRLAQLQQTVLRTERLRLLGQVSGGLAHQLRNAVTGANLAVQMHARECPIGKQDEALAVALRQLSLMEVHLQRFLHLGKELDLRLEPVSLAMLVDEAVRLLGPRCQHTGIDLRWQKPDTGEDWTMRGDPRQLSHLFVNVLTNAIEAAGPGGWVAAALTRTDSCAVLEVLDSGPGVAEDIATRLFEPFVTGKPDGVGLGLAVGRQVVEAHGGCISWTRAPAGTCFRIELPLR